MPITPEESTAVIEAINAGTPLNEIAALGGLGEAVVIRTTAQDADFRAGIIEAEVEPAIKSRIGEVHGGYDKDIKEITGLDRPADVKTYDFLKTVLNDNKTKVSTLEQTVASLKTGGGADNTKLIEKHTNDLAELEKTFQTKLGEKDTALEEFKTQIAGKQKASTVEAVFSSIQPKLIQNLPPMFDKTLQYMKVEATKNTRVEEDGTVVMLEADGLTVKRNANMQLVTLEHHLLNELKDVLQQATPAAGTGGEPPQAAGAGSPADVEKYKSIEAIAIPETIKTKLALTNHIEKELKLTTKDANFNLIMEKFGANLPVR